MQKPYLSVVIPAYNEAANFRNRVLDEPLEYLKKQKYSWELVFVDDGSTDDTHKLLKNLCSLNNRVNLIKIPHGGKAAAVIAGVLAAKGKYILLTDFDQSTPIDQVEKFLEAHQNGADIVTGTRVKTERDTLVRKIRSWAFVTLVQIVALPGIKDSQCGFKSFTNVAAQKIFKNLKIYPLKNVVGGFMGAWEVEVFFLARKYGFRIDQLPVRWIKIPSEKLNIWKEPLQMAIDTFKIRIYDILGRYG